MAGGPHRLEGEACGIPALVSGIEPKGGATLFLKIGCRGRTADPSTSVGMTRRE
jgi:hypothetical protein